MTPQEVVSVFWGVDIDEANKLWENMDDVHKEGFTKIADWIQGSFVDKKPLIAIGEKLGVGIWREAMDDLRPLIGKEYPWPNSF